MKRFEVVKIDRKGFRMDDPFVLAVRKIMDERAIKAPEIAKKIGLTPQAVYRILDGRSKGKHDTREKIASVLGFNDVQSLIEYGKGEGTENELLARIKDLERKIADEKAKNDRLIGIIEDLAKYPFQKRTRRKVSNGET